MAYIAQCKSSPKKDIYKMLEELLFDIGKALKIQCKIELKSSVLFHLRQFTTSEEFLLSLKAVVQRCSVKNVFLKISQNLQENLCARVSGFWLVLLKERLRQRRFPMNFAKFLKHLFLQNTSSGCFCLE